MFIKATRIILSLIAILLLTAAQLPNAQTVQPGARVSASDNAEAASSAFTGVWLPLGSGTNSSVTSLAVDSGGNLYAGGSFTQAGGVNALLVAKWNGQKWSSVGPGINADRVEDLAVDDQGTVYTVYYSYSDSNTWTYDVARWNGSSWVTLGEVTHETIYEMAVDSAGNLYVAGAFSQISGVAAANIARWDGTAWSGLESGLNGSAYALAIAPDGSVYAGGGFDQAGGVPVNGIAKWDGMQWSALGSESGNSGSVQDLLVDKNGNVYATYSVGVYLWNGSSWETLDGWSRNGRLEMDANGRLFAAFYEFTLCGLGFDEDPCGTYESVNTWQDGGWVPLSMVHGYIFDLLYDDHKLYVAGAFSGMGGYGTIGGTGANNIAMMAQQSFADVPPSHPYYEDIETLYANGLTAGCLSSPLKFCPDQSLNRAQMAVYVLRGSLGTDYVPVPASHLFADDWSVGAWAEPWAEGMYLQGFSAGCLASPLKYCPWDRIPREQAVIFALRMKYGTLYTPPPATGALFADMTDPGYYATSWAEQAYQEGIIPNCGMSGGKPKFCPKELVSRGLGAYMIVRAKNLTRP